MKITNWMTDKTIYEDEKIDNMKELVEVAVKKGVSLGYADLCEADLNNANLSYADLRDADMHKANLSDTKTKCRVKIEDTSE